MIVILGVLLMGLLYERGRGGLLFWLGWISFRGFVYWFLVRFVFFSSVRGYFWFIVFENII